MNNFNRLGNCKNKYQGDIKKVLCVCSAGLLRSPTMARILAEEYGFNTRAVGVSTEFALIPIDEVLVEWADLILTAESWMVEKIDKEFPTNNKQMVSLGIPDNYPYMHPELVESIKRNYETKVA